MTDSLALEAPDTKASLQQAQSLALEAWVAWRFGALQERPRAMALLQLEVASAAGGRMHGKVLQLVWPVPAYRNQAI